MTSPAKMAAAVQNAQKSTGPKTEEGKRRSRMNALKHGLTAKTVLLPEEHPAEFQELLVGWFDSIGPQDRLEASLVERGVYSVVAARSSEPIRSGTVVVERRRPRRRPGEAGAQGRCRPSAEAASRAVRAAGGVFVRWENGRRS